MKQKEYGRFQMDFDHYKKVIRKKEHEPMPVISYSYKKQYIRIDQYKKGWVLSGKINEKTFFSIYSTYKEAYNELDAILIKYRIYVLFL